MNKTYQLILLLTFAMIPSKAQLKIDKKSIEKTIKEKVDKGQNKFIKIEILSANEKITVDNDSVFFTREIKKLDTEQSYFYDSKFDSKELENIDFLNDEGLKLDKAPYKVITFLSDKSIQEKEYQSNHQLDELFKRVRIKTNDDFEYFLDFLPSGNYTYNLFINQPIKVKSDFFTQLEKLMNDEDIYLKKGTLNQPKIVLNQKQITFTEANQLDANQVKSITIYKDENTLALYGSSAKDGIVVIELK